MKAFRSLASALSFFKLAGFLRNRKSMSTVVTGAPCKAAPALPIKIASRLCCWSNLAIRINRGAASIWPSHSINAVPAVEKPIAESQDSGTESLRALTMPIYSVWLTPTPIMPNSAAGGSIN